jgi:hypothetical protein
MRHLTLQLHIRALYPLHHDAFTTARDTAPDFLCARDTLMLICARDNADIDTRLHPDVDLTNKCNTLTLILQTNATP